MMKKAFKIIGALAVVGIVAAIYIWFFVYNKPHRNYETAKADFTLTASSCYQQYANGSANTAEYTGKVLQIEGIPTSIEENDSTVVIVFAFNEGMFGEEGIRCTMLPNYNQKTIDLNITESISLKGYCSGYNDTDVIMENCSIATN